MPSETHGVTRIRGATRAVDEASFQVRGGEIVALVGKNGAGKTTLMRIAAGELSPDTSPPLRRPT